MFALLDQSHGQIVKIARNAGILVAKSFSPACQDLPVILLGFGKFFRGISPVDYSNHSFIQTIELDSPGRPRPGLGPAPADGVLVVVYTVLPGA